MKAYTLEKRGVISSKSYSEITSYIALCTLMNKDAIDLGKIAESLGLDLASKYYESNTLWGDSNDRIYIYLDVDEKSSEVWTPIRRNVVLFSKLIFINEHGFLVVKLACSKHVMKLSNDNTISLYDKKTGRTVNDSKYAGKNILRIKNNLTIV